jgi:hypothetical protein
VRRRMHAITTKSLKEICHPEGDGTASLRRRRTRFITALAAHAP